MTRSALSRAPGAWALLLVSLIFAGVFVVRHRDGWATRALRLDLLFAQEQSRAETMEMQHGLIEARLARREAIARALARGEMTLERAAAAFRELDRWTPEENWSMLRRTHSDLSAEEFSYLTVISFTKRYLAQSDPPLARRVAERLGREFDQVFSRSLHASLPGDGQRVVE